MLSGTTNYTLHGKNIVHMTQGSNNLHFFYDTSNKPAIVEFNGTKYAYVHNLQGDIVAILDSAGTVVVQYKYDAWGRQIDCTFETGNNAAEALSTLNPFRYRGYVYDEETGMYYLRSRYYNVSLCRFLNADSLIESNLYRYCDNTPASTIDATGCSASDARFSMCVAEGGGYLSPSELQPNAILKNGRGSNKGKIPVSYLLAYLDQMAESGEWKFSHNPRISMKWKLVDCIGMIRICYQQWSQKLAANSPNSVPSSITRTKQAGITIYPLLGNEHLLEPGMAIYWYDPDNRNSKGMIEPWDHIGVYMGDYRGERDVVIEAASGSYDRVVSLTLKHILENLPADETLFFAYLPDVDYLN